MGTGRPLHIILHRKILSVFPAESLTIGIVCFFVPLGTTFAHRALHRWEDRAYGKEQKDRQAQTA
jgi:hypothetical protein